MLFLHAYLLCQSGKEWSYLKCELLLIYLEAWCSMMKNFHCKLWYANMLPAVEKCVFFWLFNRKTRSRRIWTKYCLLTQKSPRKRSTGPFDQVITQINYVELETFRFKQWTLYFTKYLFSRALTTRTKARHPHCVVRSPLTTQGVVHQM